MNNPGPGPLAGWWEPRGHGTTLEMSCGAKPVQGPRQHVDGVSSGRQKRPPRLDSNANGTHRRAVKPGAVSISHLQELFYDESVIFKSKH